MTRIDITAYTRTMIQPCCCCDALAEWTECVTVSTTGTELISLFPGAPGDYTGLTEDGDPVCAHCWCPACGNGHASAVEYERCGEVEVDPHDPELISDPDRLYDLSRGA
jgi:hypothetical protein